MRWRGDTRHAVGEERHGLGSVEPLHAGVFMVVQRFRGDLGFYVHLHALATAGAFEESGAGVRFLPAPPPTPERMTTWTRRCAPACRDDRRRRTRYEGRQGPVVVL